MIIEKKWAYPAATIAAVLLGTGLLVMSLARIGSLERRIDKLQDSLVTRLEAARSETIEGRNQLVAIATSLNTRLDLSADEPETELELRYATSADAEAAVKKLGDRPKADALARTIAEMDDWLVRPEQEEPFREFKLGLQARLRGLISDEVAAHQAAALAASTGDDGMQEHVEAGRILAMFPMSDEAAVLDEARRLAGRQAEIPARLEILRRQRYNRWATDQIEKSLDFYNSNVSKINPFADNAVLIGALVENLGCVDPATLEPAVLELYNYVLARTKGSISEKNKLELTKRLTDTSVRRKVLGDF